MDRRTFFSGALAVVATAGASAQADTGDWVRLTNGKDLSGWHVKDGKADAWKAFSFEEVPDSAPKVSRSFFDRLFGRNRKPAGGVISCVAPGGGWLASDKEYGDFELKVEYRIPAGGNSGLGIRFPAVGDPAHVGMEIQILDDAAPEYKNLKAAQYNGGIYYQSPAKTKASNKPGEWNQYYVRAKGPHIQVVLNGVEIQNVNVEEFTKGEGGYKPLAERPRKGHIGFQSHGHRVDFRNVQIREL